MIQRAARYRKASFSVGLAAFVFLCFPPVYRAAPQARTAQRSFKTNCASCHAQDGSGKTAVGRSLKAQDLRSPEIQKKPDEDLALIVREGKKNMPAFKSLAKEEVQDLISYIRQLAKK